jgi:hypothetical protein
VYTTFPNCQRLSYICAARGGSGSLQALDLALREALPHLGQLEAVEVDVEQQQEVEEEEEQEVDVEALLLLLLRNEGDTQVVDEQRSSAW